MRSEASFAALCGVSPVGHSSGSQRHHRLNRGGDRRANAALYRIVQSWLRFDARTRNLEHAEQGRGDDMCTTADAQHTARELPATNQVVPLDSRDL
ncbi:transposase [Streptomyces platensis]|uniref:transposase n=1 Tax=Streptomyces platensis TaxID=58346 RepID=UPI003870913E